MTNEEAIKELKNICKQQDYDNACSGWDCCKCEYHMAIVALEKQIPKKPIRKVVNPENGFRGAFCPNCVDSEELILASIFKPQYYCSTCGQRIDWSKEE